MGIRIPRTGDRGAAQGSTSDSSTSSSTKYHLLSEAKIWKGAFVPLVV